MIRLRKGIRVTIGSSKVDTNAAQNRDKLKIDFHFPLAKNLLEWTDLVSDKASLCAVIMFAKQMGLRCFYADQVKTLLLRWTFPCVAINFMILKSKRCSLFHASFILWFTQLRMHWHQKWSENDITFLRSFFLFSLRKVDHMLRFTNFTNSDWFWLEFVNSVKRRIKN